MTDREIMQQALDALEIVTHHFTRTPSTLKDSEARGEAHAAITALRSRLAQPEQEPVVGECKSGGLNVYWYATHGMIQVTFE